MEEKIELKIREARRFKRHADIFKKWLLLEKKNHNICDIFLTNKEKKFAIYGYGQMGMLLMQDMLSQGIHLQYIIDKNADKIKCDLPIYKLEDAIPQIDILIVTIEDVYPIAKNISQRFPNCEIIRIDDLVCYYDE